MPLFDYQCSNCKKIKELLTGTHISSNPDIFKCECGGSFERIFTPSNTNFDVPGGYYDTYVRKAKLNDPQHKTDYLSNDNISPY